MRSVPLKNINITDSIGKFYIDLVKDVVIPYQWDALNDRIEDAEPSGCINNFKIAAGEKDGQYIGMVFQDSDIGKWLEAVGYSLQWCPDKELEAICDEVIDLLGRAQDEDGYLNTYFTIKEKGKRFTNLTECHELYCLGHLVEGAVAYFEATGKRKYLEIVCKYVDYIDTIFGNESGKISAYDGHEEIELALVKLYNVTGNRKYLELATFFIEERGKEPYYFDIEWEKRGKTSHWTNNTNSNAPSLAPLYNQTQDQPKNQTSAEGHAVRLVYLATAMADLAKENNDKELLEACKALWNSIVKHRIYITGAIGSTRYGEAFTYDYDLPNDTAYAETCASIGLIFFANRMIQLDPNGEYGDIIDLALYNTVLASMSLDGKRFFYVNPLEVLPEACGKNADFDAVKSVRQKWFGCACCPPNIARLLSSLGQYIYSVDDRTIYTHLFIGNTSDIVIENKNINLEVIGNYPFDDNIKIKISPDSPIEFTFALRIPAWSKNTKIKVNNEAICLENIISNGYAKINREFHKGDIVELVLDMNIVPYIANVNVKANANKVAIMRGPVVYCLEESDNNKNLHDIRLSLSDGFRLNTSKKLPLLVPSITVNKASRLEKECLKDFLYAPITMKRTTCTAELVPYFIWGNRNKDKEIGEEMMVWVNYDI